jgi:hypothetical protein
VQLLCSQEGLYSLELVTVWELRGRVNKPHKRHLQWLVRLPWQIGYAARFGECNYVGPSQFTAPPYLVVTDLRFRMSFMCCLFVLHSLIKGQRYFNKAKLYY